MKQKLKYWILLLFIHIVAVYMYMFMYMMTWKNLLERILKKERYFNLFICTNLSMHYFSYLFVKYINIIKLVKISVYLKLNDFSDIFLLNALISNLTSKLLIRLNQKKHLILITKNSVKRTDILTNLIILRFISRFFILEIFILICKT